MNTDRHPPKPRDGLDSPLPRNQTALHLLVVGCYFVSLLVVVLLFGSTGLFGSL